MKSELQLGIEAAQLWFRGVGFECAKAFNAHNEAVSQAQKTLAFVMRLRRSGDESQMTKIGAELAKVANMHCDQAELALDMIDLVTEINSLPDDMPLRARLVPGLFHLVA